MISRCSAESPARHFRSIALLSFFSSAVAGLSDRSSIAAAASSSNSSSRRRLSAEMALKRAIASSHVDTDFIESTDDAYVGGNVTPISPHIAGFVAEILVTDNQRVDAGQVLVRLDDRDVRS